MTDSQITNGDNMSELDLPLRWTKPRRIFVNSMSDLFHDKVPDEYIARVFAVMALAPQHTFQLLTKRHGRMAARKTARGVTTATSCPSLAGRRSPTAPTRTAASK